MLQQQHQRRPAGKDVQQAYHCFEQSHMGRQFISDRDGQIRIAQAQLGQQAREFGQPEILQQVLRRVFHLQSLA